MCKAPEGYFIYNLSVLIVKLKLMFVTAQNGDATYLNHTQFVYKSLRLVKRIAKASTATNNVSIKVLDSFSLKLIL